MAGLVPVLSGFATISIERHSYYLQKRRNRAMAKGLKELKRNQNLQYNKLNELANDFLLYRKYNAENTEKIMLTINSWQNSTSRLEGLFLGIKNEWSSYYYTQELGIPYPHISYNYIYMSVQKDVIDCMKPNSTMEFNLTMI